MMKKIAILSVLIVVAVSAFAQDFTPARAETLTTESGTLELSGVVLKKVAIVVTPIGDYNNLDLSGAVTTTDVAEVTEYSNVKAGYTIAVTSANSFALVGANGADANGDTVPYTLSYYGKDWDATNSAAVDGEFAKTGRSGEVKTVAMNYNVADVNLFSGTYTDEVTFTITAK